MPQNKADRLGYSLFFFRGLYIYLTIAIATVIALMTRDPGPFADAAADRIWIWSAVAVACAGALIRIITSGFAAHGTSAASKARPKPPNSTRRAPIALCEIRSMSDASSITPALPCSREAGCSA